MTTTQDAAVPSVAGTPGGGRARPTLVVLVDNHVEGDSRVQKCALTAAEAGYRVVLVGRARGAADTYTIGDAGATVEVRRVEAPFRLLALSRRTPRGRWMLPTAYPSADHAARVSLELRALTADLDARKLLLGRVPPGPGRRLRALRLDLATVRLLARRSVHLVRAGSLRLLTDRATRERSLAHRAGTRLRTLLFGRAAWRGLDPVLLDMELGFGPVLDELDADVLHANDFRTSGVAVRAAARAAARGRRTGVVYDVHESVADVLAKSPRWRTANVAHEGEFIGCADVVLTVSERLAQLLQTRYRLQERPRVVLNAPRFDPRALPPEGGLRAACGLPPETPLLVYAGSAAPQRGIETALDGLAHLPGVHLALLVDHPARVEELERYARRAGVSERLHVHGYVPQADVVPFLRSATAGLVPIHHVPNHEIALITKYLEYAHAGLPVVTSDTETMGGTTRALGNGEVFRAQDVADFVRAVRAVVADPAHYRAAYGRSPDVLHGWSWDEQRRVLLDAYAQALGAGVAAPTGERA